MIDRVRHAIPPTILALIAWLLLGDLALDVYRTHLLGDRGASRAALGLASTAIWVVTSMLLPLGLNELAQRRDGVERALLTGAAVTAGLLAFFPILQIYLDLVATPSIGWLQRYWVWSVRVGAGGMLVVSALLAGAAAQRGQRGVLAGVALVLTTLLVFRFQTAHNWLLFDDRRAHRWANLVLTSVYSLAYLSALAATTFVVGDRAPPRTAEPGAVPRYLEQIGSALVARVFILIGVAAFTAMAIGARSPGLFKLLLVMAPIGLLLSMIAQVVATFRLAALPDGPRLRLTVGASLTLATMIVSTSQAIAAYRAGRGDHRMSGERASELIAAWPYLLPALALLGLLLLLSSVSSLRRRIPTLDPDAPTVAGAWMVGASLGALLLQRSTPKSASEFVMLALAVAACNVVAVIAVARVCHKTAWAFAAGEPTLPGARVVPPDRNPM